MSIGLFAPPPAQRAQQLFQQGLAAQRAGDLSTALARYQEAAKLLPKHFDALHLGGAVALQLGQPDLALDLMNRALKIDRDNVHVLLNRGAVYAELGDWDLALTNLNKVIALQPGMAKAWNNRGNVHRKQGRVAEARADYEQAIQLDAQYFSPLNNLSNVLAEQADFEGGVRMLERALAIEPQSVDAHWNLGMACLRLGEFERGWLESEWRLHRHANLGLRASYEQPRWQGEALAGKTLLVCAEQGLGDSIQFCRYLPWLLDQGAEVIFEVQAALIPLLPARPGLRYVPQGSELPAHDWQVPLLSLPWLAHTDLGNMPPALPDLQVNAELVAQWQARLGPRQRPRVGIAWSGNPTHVDDHRRSIPLAHLLPALPEGVDWISLHKDVRPSDQAALDSRADLRFVGEHLHSYADTAALCACLDLVISVDTSVVHLAASLGRPTWVLLAAVPDWRWLLARDDSPWYPSVKLLRQAQIGDWSQPFAAIASGLPALAG